MEEALTLCRELKPDLLVFTGDFVNGDDAELDRLAHLLRELAGLRPPLGAFGIRGNHEHYADPERVTARMEAYGFRMLVNAHHLFELDGAKLALIGTDNTGMRQRYADLPRAMAGLDPEAFRILLTHDPTFWERAVMGRVDIPLTLAGHTHGGQVGLEWGPIKVSTSSLVYNRWAGLYREGEQYLYINRGLGTTGPPIRLGIPPEVTDHASSRLRRFPEPVRRGVARALRGGLSLAT